MIDNNDKSKCRPIAFPIATGGQLYFGIGNFKEVYKQIQQNSNIEFCTTVGKEFLSYFGKAVFEKDDTITENILASAPSMQKIYNEKTGYKLAIFCVKKQPQNLELCWESRKLILLTNDLIQRGRNATENQYRFMMTL